MSVVYTFRCSVFFTGAAASAAAAAALVITGEESVLESLIQTEALGWVILQRFLYEVKQLLVVLALRHHVILLGGERA